MDNEINKIAGLIKDNGLKPGDIMINVHGTKITNSCVLDEKSFACERKEWGFFSVIGDHPVTGRREEVSFNRDAFKHLGLFAQKMSEISAK